VGGKRAPKMNSIIDKVKKVELRRKLLLQTEDMIERVGEKRRYRDELNIFAKVILFLGQKACINESKLQPTL